MKTIKAPWTIDQVESLNAYQKSGVGHPYTWGMEIPEPLIATTQGWITAPGGPVVQDWAHEETANWSWKEIVNQFSHANEVSQITEKWSQALTIPKDLVRNTAEIFVNTKKDVRLGLETARAFIDGLLKK